MFPGFKSRTTRIICDMVGMESYLVIHYIVLSIHYESNTAKIQ